MDPQLLRQRAQASQPPRGEKLGNPMHHVRLALRGRVSNRLLSPPLVLWASVRVGEV